MLRELDGKVGNAANSQQECRAVAAGVLLKSDQKMS